jgi:DNA-directed RNA polymerase specialized sigma24 family protein
MKNDIENQAVGYQELIDEVEKENAEIDKHMKYLLAGLTAGRTLSDQEYKCFIDRALYKNRFSDIAYNLQISESTAKTYYQRALQKLQKEAQKVKLIYRRK